MIQVALVEPDTIAYLYYNVEEVHEDRWLGMPPVVRPLVVGAAMPRNG